MHAQRRVRVFVSSLAEKCGIQTHSFGIFIVRTTSYNICPFTSHVCAFLFHTHAGKEHWYYCLLVLASSDVRCTILRPGLETEHHEFVYAVVYLISYMNVWFSCAQNVCKMRALKLRACRRFVWHQLFVVINERTHNSHRSCDIPFVRLSIHSHCSQMKCPSISGRLVIWSYIDMLCVRIRTPVSFA